MKKLNILMMAFISCTACAEDSVTPGQLALRAFSESIVAIDKKDTECKKQQAVLPYDEIKALNLSTESLKSALSYHYAQSSYLCVKPEISEFLLTSAALKSIAPDTPELTKGLEGGSDLMVTHLTQKFKAEARYLMLSEKERNAVERIEALKQPFSLIDSATALNLFAKPE